MLIFQYTCLLVYPVNPCCKYMFMYICVFTSLTESRCNLRCHSVKQNIVAYLVDRSQFRDQYQKKVISQATMFCEFLLMTTSTASTRFEIRLLRRPFESFSNIFQLCRTLSFYASICCYFQVPP